jgi:hypothetical protein
MPTVICNVDFWKFDILPKVIMSTYKSSNISTYVQPFQPNIDVLFYGWHFDVSAFWWSTWMYFSRHMYWKSTSKHGAILCSPILPQEWKFSKYQQFCQRFDLQGSMLLFLYHTETFGEKCRLWLKIQLIMLKNPNIGKNWPSSGLNHVVQIGSVWKKSYLLPYVVIGGRVCKKIMCNQDFSDLKAPNILSLTFFFSSFHRLPISWAHSLMSWLLPASREQRSRSSCS